ncbi:MAG: DUF47 domain-containing protein [Candidatus Ranarchaeia archaeon]
MPKAEDYLVQNDVKTRQIEKQVLQISQDHVRKVQDAIKTLNLMVSDWVEKKDAELESHLHAIVNQEKEADRLKRDIFNVLSQATTLLQREDLMDLITIVDQIIDQAEGSAHILITLKDFSTTKTVRERISKLFDPVNHIVRETRETIRILPVNMQTAVDISHHIDDIEREIDSMQREIRRYLLKTVKTTPTLILTLDLVEHLETIADLCEDVADAIRIFALGRLG